MSQRQDPATAGEAAQDYLLGCDADELARLAFQHRVWAGRTFDLWEKAAFGFGSTLLDLGCGPGFATIDLAHLLGPACQVVAVDSSASFLAFLTRQAEVQGIAGRIDPRQGDLHELELEAESLDGAYARWVFCFLREPETVLRRVASALRPGARIAITDYFNYRAFTFGPRGPAMDRVVAAVQEAWLQTDGDLGIQGRMPALLEGAGLKLLSIESAHRVARPGSPLWNWPRTFFDSFLPKLVQMDLLTPQDKAHFGQEWALRSGQGGSFLSIPPMYDLIAEKR